MMNVTMATNAVDETFERVRAAGRLAFIPYLTAGYPGVTAAVALGEALAAHGADMLEVGIPFSDPMGDGPTIQRSSNGALRNGMTVAGSLSTAATLADRTGKPIVMMGYINPLLRYGLPRFCADAATAGVSGLIVPDLPVEESDELRESCRAHGIHLIYLLAPTSTDARVRSVAARASGFVYCMAVTGVTGARADLSTDLGPFLERVRADLREAGHAELPLVVGFGISRPEHLQRLRGVADGAVVASALIDLIDQTPEDQRDAAVAAYIERMSAACYAS